MMSWTLISLALAVLALLSLGGAVGVARARQRKRSSAAVVFPPGRPSQPTPAPRNKSMALKAAPVVSNDSTPIPDVLVDLSLLSEEDLDDDGQATLAQICAQYEEPHPVQRKLATGLDEPEDLIEVVSADAGLSADVLRTVNSAAFALMAPITSVPQAVNYLGVAIVRALVLRATLIKSPDEQDPEREQALMHLWQSACAASAMARLLALDLGRSRPSILGTKALFTSIGDVAVMRCIPGAESWYEKSSSMVDRIRQQQSQCGLNSALVGAALARQWSLPEEIRKAIAGSYLPLVNSPVGYPLRGEARIDNVLVYLAMVIGDRTTYHGMRDIASLDLSPGSVPELYWLDAHLHAARLGRVTDLLQTSAFRHKANRVLQTFAART